MANTVDKTLLNDFINIVVRRLAAIGVEDILEMLNVDENLTGIEVFNDLLNQAFNQLNSQDPLFLKQWVYFCKSGGDYEFVDNFDMYLAGTCTRTGLQIPPRRINSVSSIHYGTTRNLMYEAPIIINHPYQIGTVIFNTITDYPVRKAFDGNKYNKDSAIYFLGKFTMPRLKRMQDYLVVLVCEHIIRLNENLQHPNLPLETFQGLQTYYSELKSKNEQEYETSHGYAGIYK